MKLTFVTLNRVAANAQTEPPFKAHCVPSVPCATPLMSAKSTSVSDAPGCRTKCWLKPALSTVHSPVPEGSPRGAHALVFPMTVILLPASNENAEPFRVKCADRITVAWAWSSNGPIVATLVATGDKTVAPLMAGADMMGATPNT